MTEKNGRRLSQIHMLICLIGCLSVLGCDNSYEDWSDKDADFLITQLKTNPHPDYTQRYEAVFLLASKTQERDKVIPALTHVLLNDEYQTVRVAAARSLVLRMEPPAVSAIPTLIEALQREDRGRQLDYSDGVPVVSELPSNRNLHEVVIELLGEMGPDAAEAIPALLELFRSERDFWADVGLAIRKIDPSMRDLVKEELIERRASGALAVLAKKEGDVSLIPFFIQELNDPEDHVRLRAAYVLKGFGIGTPEALGAAVPAFIQLLNAPEDNVRLRYYAAGALKDIGTPEALGAVVPFYIQELNNRDASARSLAAEALRDIGTPEALKAVEESENQ